MTAPNGSCPANNPLCSYLSQQLFLELGDPDSLGLDVPAWVVDQSGRGLSTNGTFAERLPQLMEQMRERDVAEAVVRRPAALLDALAHRSDDGECHVIGAWGHLVRLVEAMARVSRDASAPQPFTAGEWAVLRPLLDRTKFVALSLPFRVGSVRWKELDPRGRSKGVLGGDDVLCPTEDFYPTDDLGVIYACRTARQVWATVLDEQQSHVMLLAHASGGAVGRRARLEDDVEDLVLVRAMDGITDGGPLVLASSGPPTVLDEALAAQVTASHLLPRAMLGAVNRVAMYYNTHRVAVRHAWGPLRDHPVAAWWAVLVPAVALAAAAVIMTLTGRYTWAAGVAVGFYGLIGVSSLVGGVTWMYPWLLRQPATAGLGVLVLVTLSPRWWLTAGWWPGAALVITAYGYLVLELRAHQVTAGRSVGRAVATLGIGMVHAFLVALMFLRWVAPQFAEPEDPDPVGQVVSLIGWWGAHSSIPQPHILPMLWLATTWGLAVGVFTQILWDDKPVTAPLSHLEWRRS